MNMMQIPTLLIREFQGNRGAFMIVPLVLAGFLLVTLLVALVVGQNIQVSVGDDVVIDVRGDLQSGQDGESGRGNHEAHDLEWADGDDVRLIDYYQAALQRLEGESDIRRAEVVTKGLVALSSPLFITLWISVMFYMLDTLYGERKDRSVLFWKSMPVSDTTTVISKVLAGLVLAPVIYMIVVMASQFVALVIASLAAIGSGVSVWDVIWAPSNLVVQWLQMFVYAAVAGLWMLPFFGWILLASAFARSLPLAWAGGVPAGISIVEAIFTRDQPITRWFFQHAVPGNFEGADNHLMSIEYMMNMNLLIAIVVGAVMIAGAIYFRGKNDEI